MRIDPRLRLSVIPVIAAFSALFLVLPSKGAGKEITMVGRGGRFEYAPQITRIEAGGAVTFSNESKVTHTATCDGCPWDTGDVQPGMIKTITLGHPGRYTFFCRYHGVSGGMVGGVEVLEEGASPETLPTPAATPAGVAPAASG